MDKSVFAKRSSVRNFKADEVPEDIVQSLLQAAIEAPSAGNCQPWHFYVVRNAQMKKDLCLCAYGQSFIEAAPLVIVVCAEADRSARRYAQRGETLYCIQDTAAAIENILLCATQHGLGACWCGAFEEASVSDAMSLPESRRPIAIIPIGYPKGINRKPGRRSMKEVITFVD